MKKIYLFMTMAMMAFATAFTACEDEQVNPNNNDTQNDGDENENYQMYSFNTTLDYTSTNPTGSKGYSASANQLVSQANADICAGSVNQYGDFICASNANLLTQCYDANSKDYRGTKATLIQNLGDVDIDDYRDVDYLSTMSITPSYLGGSQKLGSGIDHISNGQAFAFQTSDGCKGVAKVSSVTKLNRKITISGYVAVPKNSSLAK